MVWRCASMRRCWRKPSVRPCVSIAAPANTAVTTAFAAPSEYIPSVAAVVAPNYMKVINRPVFKTTQGTTAAIAASKIR